MGYRFPISEMFESVQGEGNSVGMRSLFVRFQFCNLNCFWCDTKYTWLKHTGEFETISTDVLKEKIRDFEVRNVIFTGGEPALHALDELVEDGFKYHVESNGTIIPTKDLEMTLPDNTVITRKAMKESVISKFNWVISPKHGNARQEIVPTALSYWAKAPFAVFKFICRNISDLDEIEHIVDSYAIPRDRTYVGLEGVTLESQLRPELVEEIIKRKFSYSPRIHIMLWGTERKR